jgi:hypothetical protein
MLNVKSKITVAILIVSALFLSGCSALGKKSSVEKVQTTYNTVYHTKVDKTLKDGTEIKDAESWVYVYNTATPTMKKEVSQILGTFQGKITKLTYVTMFVKDTSTMVQHVLDPDQDIAVEVQAAPLEGENWYTVITILVPLESLLANQNGAKKPVFIVEQREGSITAESLSETLSFLTNGKLRINE